MERHGRPRRRPEAPSAPTTITELARRYHSCAVALAKSLGLPMTEAFLRDHRESVSSIFIASDRAGLRLPSGVQLPPLAVSAGEFLGTVPNNSVRADAGKFSLASNENSVNGHPEFLSASEKNPTLPTNGDAPKLTVVPPDAGRPTSIPAGLQLPCAEALIVDLRPPQLSLLIGKVGLKALADKSLEPLHVALLAERARRFEAGKRPEAHGDGA